MKLYFSDGTYDVSHWLLQGQRANHWDDLMPLAESFMTQDEINRLDMQGILERACGYRLNDVQALHAMSLYSGIGQLVLEYMNVKDVQPEDAGIIMRNGRILVATTDPSSVDWFSYLLASDDTTDFDNYAKTRGITIDYAPIEK